jgi:hypothetical protein
MGPLRGSEEPTFRTPVFVAFAGSAAQVWNDKTIANATIKQRPRISVLGFILILLNYFLGLSQPLMPLFDAYSE